MLAAAARRAPRGASRRARRSTSTRRNASATGGGAQSRRELDRAGRRTARADRGDEQVERGRQGGLEPRRRPGAARRRRDGSRGAPDRPVPSSNRASPRMVRPRAGPASRSATACRRDHATNGVAASAPHAPASATIRRHGARTRTRIHSAATPRARDRRRGRSDPTGSRSAPAPMPDRPSWRRRDTPAARAHRPRPTPSPAPSSARASPAAASSARSDAARPSSGPAADPPTVVTIASAPAAARTPATGRSSAQPASASASGAPSCRRADDAPRGRARAARSGRRARARLGHRATGADLRDDLIEQLRERGAGRDGRRGRPVPRAATGPRRRPRRASPGPRARARAPARDHAAPTTPSAHQRTAASGVRSRSARASRSAIDRPTPRGEQDRGSGPQSARPSPWIGTSRRRARAHRRARAASTTAPTRPIIAADSAAAAAFRTSLDDEARGVADEQRPDRERPGGRRRPRPRPTTSRAPPAPRATWTTTSTEARSCSQIASCGQPDRRRTARGSTAGAARRADCWRAPWRSSRRDRCSAPGAGRTPRPRAPRRRRADRDACATRRGRDPGRCSAPAPSALAGRASSRTTCGCGSRSSAVSSMVMMRSVGTEMTGERVEQGRLARSGTTGDHHVGAVRHQRRAAARRRRRSTPNASRPIRRAPKRRIVRHGPSIASGGITACRRDPSGSRASTIGEDRSRRSASGARMRWASRRMPASSSCSGTASMRAGPLDEAAPGAVDHDLVDRRIEEQRLERTEPDDVVDTAATSRSPPRHTDERILEREERGDPGPELGRGRTHQRLGAVGREQPTVHRAAHGVVAVGVGVGLGGAGHAAARPRARPSSRRICSAARASGSGSRVGSTPASTARAIGDAHRHPRRDRPPEHLADVGGPERAARLLEHHEPEGPRRERGRRRPVAAPGSTPAPRAASASADLEHGAGDGRVGNADVDERRAGRRAVPPRARRPPPRRPSGSSTLASRPRGSSDSPGTISTPSRSSASVGAVGPAASQSATPVSGSAPRPSTAG